MFNYLSCKIFIKHIYKSPDRIVAVTVIDKIRRYANVHYVVPSEAYARIFKESLHYCDPFVKKHQLHKENQQQVVFQDMDNLINILGQSIIDKTMFIEFFEANKIS